MLADAVLISLWRGEGMHSAECRLVLDGLLFNRAIQDYSASRINV